MKAHKRPKMAGMKGLGGGFPQDTLPAVKVNRDPWMGTMSEEHGKKQGRVLGTNGGIR